MKAYWLSIRIGKAAGCYKRFSLINDSSLIFICSAVFGMLYPGACHAYGHYSLPVHILQHCHPEVLNLPFLPHLRERFKLTFVSQIEASWDPYIREAKAILNLPEYRNAQSIPPCVISTLQTAKQSVSSITPRVSIKKTAN